MHFTMHSFLNTDTRGVNNKISVGTRNVIFSTSYNNNNILCITAMSVK